MCAVDSDVAGECMGIYMATVRRTLLACNGCVEEG